MAGVEGFEPPTRADLRYGGIRCSTNSHHTDNTKHQSQKSPSISAETLEYGRGGGIRTPNTRIWNPWVTLYKDITEYHP